MIPVKRTSTPDILKQNADKWLKKLKDLKAKAKILFRIQKLERDGHFGDCKPVGEGVRELKINFGPGYRVYFARLAGDSLILLLLGGDKKTQERDIDMAVELLADFKERYEI